MLQNVLGFHYNSLKKLIFGPSLGFVQLLFLSKRVVRKVEINTITVLAKAEIGNHLFDLTVFKSAYLCVVQ